MSADEDWGPWTSYNGEGYFPGVQMGMIVQIKAAFNGKLFTSEPQVVDEPLMFSRIVVGPGEELLAFRIRRPRGLTILESLLSDLPETVDA